MSLNNEQSKTIPFSIPDLAELKYYPYIINLDKCNGSCNIITEISDRICIWNKANDVNLSVFNLIERNNKLKILTKHVSCNSKFKFDGSKCNLNQKLKKNKCRCECKYFRKKCVRKSLYLRSS